MKINVFFLAVSFCACSTLCLASDLEVKILRLKSSNSASLEQVAENLKSSEGKVTYDANTNSLVLVDHPETIARIVSVIESLDVKQKMVEIKTTVVEASNESLSNLGLYSSAIILPEGKFLAILTQLRSDRNASINTSMSIKTLSNQPARLQVAADAFIGNEVTIYHNGTTVVTPQRQAVGNFLEVLPTVNGDGTITVTLRPEVSTMGDNLDPESRNILTSVTVKSGDTLSIGGVDSESTTKETSTSFFGIGRSSVRTSGSRKTVMFLTATTID